MKNRKIITIIAMLALIIGLVQPVQVAYAGCSVHSNYKDRVEGNSTPSYSVHYVQSGVTVNGVPTYYQCNVTTVYITHGVYCGVCNTKISTYTQKSERHSVSH